MIKTKITGEKMSKLSRVGVVVYKPLSAFKKPEPPRFQVVLASLQQRTDQMAEIPCSSEKEARELARGFHSSGTGRRLKKEGYGLSAVRSPDDSKVVHVHLTPPPVSPFAALESGTKSRTAAKSAKSKKAARKK